MDVRVQKVLLMIDENLPQPITVNKLAEAVHLSPTRLRTLFKQEAGIPLSRFMKLRRMQEAGRLLEQTSMSVKEIMFSVGIQDQSHFVRDFQKAYELSPKRYRLKIRQLNLIEVNHQQDWAGEAFRPTNEQNSQ